MNYRISTCVTACPDDPKNSGCTIQIDSHIKASHMANALEMKSIKRDTGNS